MAFKRERERDGRRKGLFDWPVAFKREREREMKIVFQNRGGGGGGGGGRGEGGNPTWTQVFILISSFQWAKVFLNLFSPSFIQLVRSF